MQKSTKKLAVEAMRKWIQKIAFDANLYDRGLCNTPNAENCSKLKKQLLQAVADLEKSKQAQPFLFKE